jgi:hypothetical protein
MSIQVTNLSQNKTQYNFILNAMERLKWKDCNGKAAMVMIILEKICLYQYVTDLYAPSFG